MLPARCSDGEKKCSSSGISGKLGALRIMCKVTVWRVAPGKERQTWQGLGCHEALCQHRTQHSCSWYNILGTPCLGAVVWVVGFLVLFCYLLWGSL
ncbi:hypothetical protein CIB84_001027 [Bambusicola thoracicus]|uniref:Uncharacterized protein n=1 Tax=Bambusicola thoracicus TaxID=9083 RepID=A0A2P4TFT4_BAMTH|nr:hypothetical protein CIB84_001027 [Bambusicola thoracicus]